MMNTPNKSHLLQQIAAIPAMERGKLSDYSFKERPGATGPYHKLQHWREGKNYTRYVSAQELPAVQAALAGYAQYRQLTEQYADLGVAGQGRLHGGQFLGRNIAGVVFALPPMLELVVRAGGARTLFEGVVGELSPFHGGNVGDLL